MAEPRTEPTTTRLQGKHKSRDEWQQKAMQTYDADFDLIFVFFLFMVQGPMRNMGRNGQTKIQSTNNQVRTVFCACNFSFGSDRVALFFTLGVQIGDP